MTRYQILEDTVFKLAIVMFITGMMGWVVPLPGDRGAWLDYHWPVGSEMTVEVKPPVYIHPSIMNDDEAMVAAVQRVYRRDFPLELVRYVYAQAKAYGLQGELVMGLIAAESSFRPSVKSNIGAVGYTQVWPKWHQDKIRGRDIYDPYVNIEVGIQFLSECTGRRRDLRGALACYNGSDSPASANRYFHRVTERRHELSLAMLDIAGI